MSGESPRADVVLSEAEREALDDLWCRDDGPALFDAVERILADRLAAVQAERDEAEGRLLAVEALADEYSGPDSLRAGAWDRHRDIGDRIRAVLATDAEVDR